MVTSNGVFVVVLQSVSLSSSAGLEGRGAEISLSEYKSFNSLAIASTGIKIKLEGLRVTRETFVIKNRVNVGI